MPRRSFVGLVAITLVAGSAVAIGSPARAVPSAVHHASSVPTGAVGNQLAGVSCVKASHCFAVGQSGVSTLVERWNGTSWSVASSPRLTGALAAVSCSTTTDCFAVGSQRVSGANRALIERWDGKSWSVVSSPHPGGSTGADLRGVSCASAKFCVAVGLQLVAGAVASKTLVQRWNGKSWSMVTSPNPAGGRSLRLNGVSCTSTTNCVAVGSYNAAAGRLSTLVERWNGTKWTVIASPTPSAGSGAELLGVACSLPSSCFAVGDSQYDSAGLVSMLAERWDGKSWSVVATPGGYQDVNQLRGVSCTSPTFCVAVGYFQYNGDPLYVAPITLVERWNGKGWSKAASPSPGSTESRLAGVSCATATRCVAVGRYSSSNFERAPNKLRTLAQRWNGTTWSTVASPNVVDDTPFAVLNDVSCTSTTNCIAVGSFQTAIGSHKTLIERWNGTSWSIVTSPNPAGATISQLSGVSCTGATSCVAVGRYTTAPNASAPDVGPFKTLIEHWNGTSWSIVASPNPASVAFARLDRVSCASATNCMAIGVASVTRTATDTALSERWDGTSWSIVPSPAFPARGSQPADVGVSGISCTSTTNCMAAYGLSFGTGRPFNHTMVEHWDGTEWTSTPTSGAQLTVDIAFSGVSCTSETNCIITGMITEAFAIGVAAAHTVVEQWNGTAWSPVPSAQPTSGSFPRLDGVSCASPTSCMAVGAYSTNKYNFDPAAPLTEQWDGTKWTLVASRIPAGASSSQLAKVSCAAPTSCMAVGSYQVRATAATKPLIERWNGTSWALVANPSPPGAA